jgi:hypothetical protein
MTHLKKKVKNLCRSESLVTVSKEIAKYKLDLAGVQKLTWDKGGDVRPGNFIFFLWERK